MLSPPAAAERFREQRPAPPRGAEGAAASRRFCPAQRHGEAVAGAAAGAGLAGPGGAAGAAGQVRGGERGPGSAGSPPPPGAGRLRAVAEGQVPGWGPGVGARGGRVGGSGSPSWRLVP